MKKSFILYLVFSLVCFSVVEAGAQSPDKQEANIPLEVQRVSENIIIVRTEQGWENQLALNTDKGIVVFGSHWGPGIGLDYNKIIEKEFKRTDYKFVINPSSRIIWIGGNVLYQDAVIIAQDEIYREIIENRPRLNELIQEEKALFARKAGRSYH